MNRQLSQINSLIEILFHFDMTDNQTLEKRRELYLATLVMINNPDIYGEVYNIALEIHRKITLSNYFNVTIEPDVKYDEYAFKLMEYLSVDDEVDI